MTLYKRIPRDLKNNFVKYTALFVLLVVGLGVIAGMASSVDSILNSGEVYHKEAKVEDGNFTMTTPLTQEQKDELKDKGVIIEDISFMDVKVKDRSELRIFKDRKNVNKVKLLHGKMAENDGEIVIEKLYAAAKGLKVGSTITIEGKEYKVTGIGTIPDYNFIIRNITDAAKNINDFSVAFVGEDTFDALKESNPIRYTYAYRLKGDMSSDELLDYLKDTPPVITASGPHINLQEFIEKEDNIRINNYAEDAKINKATAFMVGVFFMLLVAYILSVFAVQNIERERGVIGTLYSMGYRKKHALFSFISIPVVVVFVAAIFGTLVGYFLIHPLAGENTTAFSYPDIEKSYEPYVIIFTLIAPTVFTLIVNYFVINRRLKKPPLTLLRKQGSDGHMAKIDLGKMTFINRFRARQLLREIGVAITLVVGLFLAILIMALGFSTKGSIDYYIDQTAKETNYASMTLFKYPPASSYEGEKAYGRQLKIDYAATGGTADVTLLGIKENSKYFDFKVKKNKNQVYISSSAEKKLYLKKGDVIYLTDPVLKESYRFTVAGTVKYTNSLYMFMDMDKMQERFAKPNGYYNFLFSDKKGEIKDDSVKSVIKKKDVETATEQFVDLMSGTVNMLITLSILVMVITIYLLINLMIEKSAFSISLVKVLGYQRDVIRKIYLTPGGIIVFLATAISIPITKLIMNKLFPMLITNFASGMRVYIYPHMYLQMVLLIAVTYFVVNFALKRHLDRVPVTEILKNVE